MARHAEDYRVFRISKGSYYFYRLKGWPRNKRRSTYTKSLVQAVKVAKAAFEGQNQELVGLSLREVLADYYVWDRCPHIRRLLDENKRMSRLHAMSSRRAIELYVLADPIADYFFLGIQPGDCIDFRSRLRSLKIPTKNGSLKTLSSNRVNRVMTILHTVYQEEITRRGRHQVLFNPFDGVGKIQYDEKKPGIFTREETAALFPPDSLGHWRDRYDYAAYLVAMTAGMRRGEVLGLKWGHVDFIRGVIDVRESWHKGENDNTEVKWGGARRVPVPLRTVEALLDLRERPYRTADADHIFCYREGGTFGETWWRKRFNDFCARAGIDRVGRNLKPHSFRHTLTTYLTEKLQNQGIDPEVLNDYMGGWTNNKTRRRYTHIEEIVFEAQRKAAAELIGAA